MSLKVKGASTIILNKYPKATYVHCRPHVLFLSIVNSCKMSLIQNMMGRKYYNYKKSAYFLNILLRGLLEENSCARHDALRVFIELY